jgi:hypothetical protein
MQVQVERLTLSLIFGSCIIICFSESNITQNTVNRAYNWLKLVSVVIDNILLVRILYRDLSDSPYFRGQFPLDQSEIKTLIHWNLEGGRHSGNCLVFYILSSFLTIFSIIILQIKTCLTAMCRLFPSVIYLLCALILI